MKKILSVLVLTLALNFLFVIGGVGWLFQSNHLDKGKIGQIKEILFPTTSTSQPTTQPTETATTRPTMRLEEMLAKYSGQPPTAQLEYIRQSFDSQMAALNRSLTELSNREQFVKEAQDKLKRDRAALDEQEKKLVAREKQLDTTAADKGFQNTLAMYQSLPAKQVKSIFMGLDDQVIIQYLQAMEPRSSAKITKEFKSPEESQRLQRILEKMRQATTQPIQQASTKE